MITLYHSSRVVVDKPDILHSRESLDFGKGFYLTVYGLRLTNTPRDS